jgi:hypothetical protein
VGIEWNKTAELVLCSISTAVERTKYRRISEVQNTNCVTLLIPQRSECSYTAFKTALQQQKDGCVCG